MSILSILGGALLLMVAGDLLVRGAIALSMRIGLSAVLVSMTVVALGTSAPEFVISLLAALEGSPDIAVGNVVGSNIANVLLVIGVPAALMVIAPSQAEIRKNYVVMLMVTAGFAAIVLLGHIGRIAGFAMMAALVGVLIYSYRQATKFASPPDEDMDTSAEAPVWKIVTFLALGLVGLPIGAHFLIEGAKEIGLSLGLSEAAIGLTVVALGTSLPELATSTAAVMRGRGDVAIANVIGSNMFNILAVIGTTAVISPLNISRSIQSVDMPIMVACSLLLAPFLIWQKPIRRGWGVLFVVLYAVFAILALSEAQL